MDTQPSRQNSPGLWRLGFAATKLGITPRALEAASLDGSLPIEVLSLGPRNIRYVRAAEVQAFLSTKKEHACVQ